MIVHNRLRNERRSDPSVYIRFGHMIVVVVASLFAMSLLAVASEPRLLLDRVNGISLIDVPMTEKRVSVDIIFPRAAFPGPLAHYTEHLAWLPQIGKNSRPLDRHGNAWTGYPAMGYWQSGRPEDLPDILRKLATVFDPIAVPRDFAEEERDIILREYELRMADNPDGKAAEVMRAFLYEGNGNAISTIGTPAEIGAMTLEEAKNLHHATHRPELARLVVSGDVSPEELQGALRAADFPPLAGSREAVSPPPFNLVDIGNLTVAYPDHSTAPRIAWRKVVALPAPVDFDVLDIQCKLLRNILESNMPGGLAGPLRYDAMIARSFSISIFPLDEDNVEIGFYADPDSGVSFARLQSAFEVALAASAKGIPLSTFDRIHERLKEYWPDWEDRKETGRWMTNYTLERVSDLRQPLPEPRVRELNAKLTVQDINALLTTLSGPGRLAIASFGKDQKE